MSVTYFDYAATTTVSPQAMEAVVEAMQHFGNPSSRYPLGREAAALFGPGRAAPRQDDLFALAEDLPAGLERRRVGLQEYFISLMEEEDQR